MSRRRAMVALAALVIGSITRPSAAGPGPKRVAVLLGSSTAPDPIGPTRKWYAGEFAKHGLVDGRDIEIAIVRAAAKWFDKDYAAATAAAARRAVALRPVVILTLSNGSTVKNHYLPVTGDIPIVAAGPEDQSPDSIEALNRRGANVTGVMNAYFELSAKRFELMKELRPSARRAASLGFPTPPGQPVELALILSLKAHFAAAARRLGMDFAWVEVPLDASPATIVQALRKAQTDLVEIRGHPSPDPDFGKRLYQLLAENGILASGLALDAKDGALLSGWSVDWVESAIRLAAKVVRGARAANLPVERVREFRLAINLRTARTLGITVPQSILLRADEVFE